MVLRCLDNSHSLSDIFGAITKAKLFFSFSGILVSYCRGFDLINTHESFYYINGVLCKWADELLDVVIKDGLTVFTPLSVYAIGIGATFFALIVMEIAQPVLVYLVPATLGSTLVLAYCRGQLSDMWEGRPVSINDGIGSRIIIFTVYA